MTPPWFHRFAILAVFWAILLIWVGAAVTTEGVGMVVPTWPLTWGGVNPDGWWAHPGVRLEHGHRLLGAVMGILGIGLVAGAWAGRKDRILKALSVAALVAVIFQGLLGGLRVTEISNGFAVFHGCFAQAFFCLLILIVMRSSSKWGERTAEVLGGKMLRGTRRWGVLLAGAIYVQLILGATMRHTHRFGLADDGILTTGGVFFPGFGDFDLAILFSHKAWAWVVLGAVVGTCDFARRSLQGHPSLRRHAYVLAGMVGFQIAMGVGVIAFDKHFWVTNVHVLNGLAILAGAFMFAVKAFAARSAEGAEGPAGIPGVKRVGVCS